MQQQIQNLKDSQLTQVLADGFALLYHKQPKFPVTYLANYLKNFGKAEQQKKKIGLKLSENRKLLSDLSKKQEAKKQKDKDRELQQQKIHNQQEEFLNKISNTQYHEDVLDYFCNWLEKKFSLTGVYMGQLKNKVKRINLTQEDSEEAHLDVQAPKLIYFEHASSSHNFMVGKTLTQQSVLAKLLSAPEGGEAEPPAEGEQAKQQKPKDQIFFSTVVDNKELTFFKFPRLGSFFGIGLKVNSYLSNKLFDENSLKISSFQKELDQYEKLREERQTKFKQAYDQKANSGADEQQLQAMEKEYQKQQSLIQKPKLKQFDCLKRQFVFGFDTLGQDRQITKQDQKKIKEYVQHLKNSWQNTQIEALKTDIDRHLKLADKIEAPHQQTFLKIVSQEDKEVSGHEEVQKYKSNQKLMELQMDTVRVQKLKQYLGQQKYEPFLQEILKTKVLKFSQILKYWLLFCGHKKQQINIGGTNLLDLRKAQTFLTKDSFINQIHNYLLRGSKPESKVEVYAKWERLQRNLQKIDVATVAGYNIYLAFILRYLLLAAKIRKADRVKRINIMIEERKIRNTRKRDNQKKIKQKQSKLAALIAQAEQKQQHFDQQAWLAQYSEAEENQLADLGPQIIDQIDRDLQNGQQIFPDEPEPAEVAENVAAE